MPFFEKYLTVKKSTLEHAGKGLFTKKQIPKGARIIEYKGRVTPWKDADHRNFSNPYIFYITRNKVINALPASGSIAKYANDAKGIKKVKGITNNTTYNIENGRVYIDAIKDIPAGAELFVDYGKEYWDVIRHNLKIDKTKKDNS